MRSIVIKKLGTLSRKNNNQIHNLKITQKSNSKKKKYQLRLNIKFQNNQYKQLIFEVKTPTPPPIYKNQQVTQYKTIFYHQNQVQSLEMSLEYKEIIKKLKGQTVLIIDNERSTINQLRGILEPTTRVYSSDEQTHAINMINKVKPNIIMVNLDSEKNEKFNGLEICSAIKQLEAFTLIPTIPVILYANNNGGQTQERYQMSSADTLIIKPINEKSFVENLSKHEFYKFMIQN